MQKQASLTYIDVEEAPRQPRRRFRNFQPALRRFIPLLLLLAAGYRFAGLSFGEMQQWDEAIYALRTDAALRFGVLWDQSAHMLRGSYYAAHPPLYVWFSVAWRLLFGDGLWVYRLTSALAGGASVFLLYAIARRVGTRAIAFAAAGWFAAAPLPAFFSRQGQLDLLLTCLMLGTLLYMLRYLRDGSRALVAAAVMLGFALMTKLFYAFSLPAAALAAAVLLNDGRHGAGPRARALRLGLLMPLLSLPVWLPWVAAFVAQHGGGNPLFFLTDDTPLGASISGLEGSGKNTGVPYYVNQLIVQLGVLFPLYLAGLYRALRRPDSPPLVLLAAFTLTQGAELLLLRSSFEVYLIPLLGPAAVLAVHMVPRIRHWAIGRRLAMGLAMAVCFAWSVSAELRAGLKHTLAQISESPAVSGGAPLQAAVLVLLILLCGGAVLVIWKVGRLRTLFTAGFLHLFVLGLWTATAFRFWISDPRQYTDGARTAVTAARVSAADTVVLIGNGDNPQLTWYLRGADIGWQGDSGQVFLRLEPRDIGVEAIMHRLSAMRRSSVGVILEKDEIAAGVYRAPSDVLPPAYRIITDTRRYAFAVPGAADHAH